MRQRGRKSAEALAINVSGRQPRLATPKGLSAAVRAEFERVVNNTKPEHFRPSDTALLIALAQATVMVHKLGRDASRIADWERASRVMMALATKLRLTPQSRFDRKTIGAMEPEPWLRKPWQMKHPSDPTYDTDDDDDDEKKLQ